MSVRAIRSRLSEPTNIWPGFVDILSTLLIVIIFILMVFTVSQIYLSDAISGRDKALDDLRKQINELSKILTYETELKQQALIDLEGTQQKLQIETSEKKILQKDVAEKTAEITSQSFQITGLANQIQELLYELRIVANALEAYEGAEVKILETKGLGERINKALASRIEQLNELNKALSLSKEETIKQLTIVEELNKALSLSKEETTKQLTIAEDLNLQLSEKENALQNQVEQYQKLTKDLISINESLGLEDASLIEQLEAIKQKNQELIALNKSLVEKEDIISNLRNKILELNDILSIGEKKQITQQKTITDLDQKLQVLESQKQELETSTSSEILQAETKTSIALEKVGNLSDEISVLNKEIATLNLALDASEREVLTKELKIEVLGERLNKALTSKVFELQKYRSEFFGRLKTILGDRNDIKVVGDRFIFESELLFDSGSSKLQNEGREKLEQIGLTLKGTTDKIPSDIDWIIQVEGHTDKNPIQTFQFPSNWELSTARANTVLKLLLELGFRPEKLSAAGYGEFYPIALGETKEDFSQNRRIELRLTSR